MKKITVNTQKSMPLPQFLRQSFPYLQVKILSNALSRRDIKRGGERLNEKSLVHPGDELDLYIDDRYLNEQPPIDIVYEDKNILIVHKNPGESVVENKAGAASLEDRVRNTHKDAAACHRLDHNTGGLVVFSLNQAAKKLLEEAFKQRTVEKYYRCLVFGKPNPGARTLRAYLQKDAQTAKVFVHDKPIPGSVPIETGYETLDSCQTVSLLRIHLITGRTHQIRAHLAHIGHPVCGDDKYGDRSKNKEYSVTKQQLWATELVFRFGPGPLSYLDGRAFFAKPRFTMKGFE